MYKGALDIPSYYGQDYYDRHERECGGRCEDCPFMRNCGDFIEEQEAA